LRCYNAPMKTGLFEQKYKNLNAKQREAVDAIEGPVMVVAGPGTGKTTVLTLRIANILKRTDTQPENILALTFTDAAAANMRRRLFEIIGAGAYRVKIKTFHSFCNDVLSSYPESFPGIIGSAHISEPETAGLIEELIGELPLDLLRPWGDPMLYIGDIVRKIEELKREGLTPQKFEEITKIAEKNFKKRDDTFHAKGAHKGKMKGEAIKEQKKIQKNIELAIIYKAYREKLHKKRLYDWSDMIMEVLKALKEDGELKLILQEEHQYILVDEHQDSNNAQNKILELLCDFHQNPNIFVVGDEKQAIFRFQGASVENFLYFQKIYPQARLIELSENYRSTQSILDAVFTILPSKNPLESPNKKSGSKIKIAEFSNSNIENNWIAEKTDEFLKEGVEPSEIAIIYRNNRDAFPIAAALERRGVPYEIRSDEDLFGDSFVKKFVELLGAIREYGNDAVLVPVLHMEEFGLDPLAVYKIILKANKEKKNIYELLENDELSKKMKKWARDSKSVELTKLMEEVLRDSGIFNSMLKAKDANAFLGIEKIMDEAKKISLNRNGGAVLEDFMKYLDIIKAHKIFIKHPKVHYRKSAIVLMTAHRAKGLEFKRVFLTGADERAFGPGKNRDKLPIIIEVYECSGISKDENSDDDERRLFYVALTRAKEEIFITCSNIDENGKEVLPSPFISDIRQDRKENLDVSYFEKKIAESPQNLFAERKQTGVKEVDREFVLELWQSHPLSVTALNNYLECPWKYFYVNLLRVPSVPARYQLYGTAMHGAVDDLYKAKKDREVDEKFLLNSYKRRLGNLGLNEKEEKEYLKKGERALGGWFRWARPDIAPSAISEFSTTVSLPSKKQKNGIILSGKLDKMEFLGGDKVAVTDFKTGKQKSRNEIEGKTQNSKGDMKRQLIFYKLLLDLHSSPSPESKLRSSGKFEMQKGIIEFLEPDLPSDSSGQAGKYKREEFEIDNSEVEELKKIIETAADEITSLLFWNKTCSDPACPYCAYRKLI
jgi:DNA helicase II / ATP-dependent DNA helicase PcrA